LLAAGSDDCNISVWNINSGECVALLGQNEPVFAIAVLQNGNLASNDGDNILIWDLSFAHVHPANQVASRRRARLAVVARRHADCLFTRRSSRLVVA